MSPFSWQLTETFLFLSDASATRTYILQESHELDKTKYFWLSAGLQQIEAYKASDNYTLLLISYCLLKSVSWLFKCYEHSITMFNILSMHGVILSCSRPLNLSFFKGPHLPAISLYIIYLSLVILGYDTLIILCHWLYWYIFIDSVSYTIIDMT